MYTVCMEPNTANLNKLLDLSQEGMEKRWREKVRKADWGNVRDCVVLALVAALCPVVLAAAAVAWVLRLKSCEWLQALLILLWVFGLCTCWEVCLAVWLPLFAANVVALALLVVWWHFEGLRAHPAEAAGEVDGKVPVLRNPQGVPVPAERVEKALRMDFYLQAEKEGFYAFLIDGTEQNVFGLGEAVVVPIREQASGRPPATLYILHCAEGLHRVLDLLHTDVHPVITQLAGPE